MEISGTLGKPRKRTIEILHSGVGGFHIFYSPGVILDSVYLVCLVYIYIIKMKTKIISFVEEINERLGYIVVTVFKHLDISRRKKTGISH